MREYSTEDRSGTAEEAAKNRFEKLSLVRVLALTDLSDEEADKIIELKAGEELIIDGWFWIKRTL